MDKKIIGNFGETIAAQYLRAHGYRLLAHNYRLSHLELDLVAFKSGLFIFFEIKTRWQQDVAITDSLISQKQKRNLKKAARLYAANFAINFEQVHFDLILITLEPNQKRARLKHYPDIF